jgi:Homing endonuclease associated repeat
MLSKEEVLAAIRECAGEVGRCPTLVEMRKFKKVGLRVLRQYFGSYTQALREAGLDPHGPGHRLSLEALFADWAQVARQLGKIPTLVEYENHGRHSAGPLLGRFGGWSEVPQGLLEFANQTGLEAEWQDVLGMIQARELPAPAPERAPWRARLMKGKPVYGSPLNPAALTHAPTNEMGVVYLFGVLAGELGFMVTRMQKEFPDCETMLQVEPDQWQRLHVEFEYESRNFLVHQHDAEACDLIVCWRHNWPECPENLEVLELSTVVGARGEQTPPALQRNFLPVLASVLSKARKMQETRREDGTITVARRGT